MTGVRITVNDRELRQVLRRLARIGGEPGRFLRPIGQQLINSTRERARREVSPDFTPTGGAGGLTGGGSAAWPELEPTYAAQKRGGHMLRESGNLLGSLTREVEGNTLRVGTNRIYAAGPGGTVAGPTSAPWMTGSLGGAPAIGGNLWNSPGEQGQVSTAATAAQGGGGTGGGSRFGAGAAGAGAGGAGGDALAPGAGGGGTMSSQSSGALKGGNGAAGAVLVWEYS